MGSVGSGSGFRGPKRPIKIEKSEEISCFQVLAGCSLLMAVVAWTSFMVAFGISKLYLYINFFQL